MGIVTWFFLVFHLNTVRLNIDKKSVTRIWQELIFWLLIIVTELSRMAISRNDETWFIILYSKVSFMRLYF